jgi:hypothetical protein
VRARENHVSCSQDGGPTRRSRDGLDDDDDVSDDVDVDDICRVSSSTTDDIEVADQVSKSTETFLNLVFVICKFDICNL